tara:strand:- start:1882 stop:2727 length:846 start_codon:yes stop_codon:yes gene_type:complete
MILIDMNQVVLANVFAYTKNSEDINEDMLRHITLNSVRLFKNQFGKKYGDVVLTFDAGNYWRKDIFEQYKAARKKKQNESDTDWSNIFNAIKNVRDELIENFPYKVMLVPRAEADDIIAWLAKKHHTQEKVLIISSDKDFQQLQRYSNIEQYSPRTKKKIVCKNPQEFLTEHIIRGDSSDGIPNILSDDDTFINPEKRQKRLTEKVMTQITEDLTFGELPKGHERNWDRNQSLVDFERVPDWINEDIKNEWEKPVVGNKSKIFNYFIKNKLRNLMEHIEEF